MKNSFEDYLVLKTEIKFPDCLQELNYQEIVEYAKSWHSEIMANKTNKGQFAVDDSEFIWELMPDWIKEHPKQSNATFYGTGTLKGDIELRERVQEILFNPVDLDTPKTANEVIRSLCSSDLRSLVVETKKIGDAKVPTKVRKTTLMSALFNLEKNNYSNWSDKFQLIDSLVKAEIIHRIRNGEY